MAKEKNEAAVSLGRLGGLKKVSKGPMVKMTAEERSEAARAIVAARWGKKKRTPAKRKAKS